jgi:hypothetical protein
MAQEKQENTAGRHIPSIILAMVVLQIVLVVTSTDKKKLPSPQAEAGIAFIGFVLLIMSRGLPQVASKFAWLIVTGAIFKNVTAKTPVIAALTTGTAATPPATSPPAKVAAATNQAVTQ